MSTVALFMTVNTQRRGQGQATQVLGHSGGLAMLGNPCTITHTSTLVGQWGPLRSPRFIRSRGAEIGLAREHSCGEIRHQTDKGVRVLKVIQKDFLEESAFGVLGRQGVSRTRSSGLGLCHMWRPGTQSSRCPRWKDGV